jgi:hypothetical protein
MTRSEASLSLMKKLAVTHPNLNGVTAKGVKSRSSHFLDGFTPKGRANAIKFSDGSGDFIGAFFSKKSDASWDNNWEIVKC